MPSPKAKVILEAERRGGAAFRSFQADLNKVARAAGVVAAAAGAALVLVTRRSFQQIDVLAKTSDQMGINTQELARMRLAAQITGVSQEQLTKGLQRLQKTVFDASQGLTTAVDALAVLGLAEKDLLNIPIEQQFRLVADAMGEVENATLRSGAAQNIFGARNVSLLNTLALGSEGLATYAAEADRLGLAVTRVDAAKIEQANDAILLARSRVEGVGNIIAVQLAPIVTALANRFTQVGDSTTTMAASTRVAIDGIAFGVGVVADALHGWAIILAGVDVAWLRTRAAAQSFSAAFNPEIQEIADETDRAQIKARLYFRTLTEAGKPSEIIALNMSRARVEAQKAAEQTALLAESAISVAGAGTESDAAVAAREAAETAAATERAALERRLETTIQFQRTSEESEIVANQRRAEIVLEAEAAALITHERSLEIQERLQFEHEDRLTQITEEGLSARDKFTKLSAQGQTKQVLGSLVQMTAGVANSNKAMFRINKLSAIGSAVVNTAQAVTRALAEYPPPLSFVMAAAQAAAGLAQIQAIKATSFGGGTTPSVAGSTPTFERQPVGQFTPPGRGTEAPERPIVQVVITGLVGSIDQETAEVLGEALHDIIADNDFELISPESAQTQAILAAAEPV